MRLRGDEDRRVRRTISSLKKAYIDLLEEKDSHKITVTELSDKALINKKTFYSYYASLDELQNEMVEEAIDTFVDKIRVYDTNDFRHITQTFFDYFSDKRVFLLNVLSPKGAEYIYKRTEEVVATGEKGGFVKASSLADNNRHFVFIFIINGLIMLFAKWFEEGQIIPKQEAINLTADLLGHGAGHYLAQPEI